MWTTLLTQKRKNRSKQLTFNFVSVDPGHRDFTSCKHNISRMYWGIMVMVVRLDWIELNRIITNTIPALHLDPPLYLKWIYTYIIVWATCCVCLCEVHKYRMNPPAIYKHIRACRQTNVKREMVSTCEEKLWPEEGGRGQEKTYRKEIDGKRWGKWQNSRKWEKRNDEECLSGDGGVMWALVTGSVKPLSS